MSVISDRSTEDQKVAWKMLLFDESRKQSL